MLKARVGVDIQTSTFLVGKVLSPILGQGSHPHMAEQLAVYIS